MSAEEATEFHGHVQIDDAGDWSWKIVPVNGRWPNWLLDGRRGEAIKTSGTTWTHWGAKVEARRALKTIRRVQERPPAEVVK